MQFTGECKGFDGIYPYVRLLSGGGAQLVNATNPGGGFKKTFVFGNAVDVPYGVQPVLPADPPPFRMDVRCASNQIPSINGPAAAPGPPDLTSP